MPCVVPWVHYHPLGFLCEPLWMYLGPWGLMIREMIESQLLQSPHHSRIPKKTRQNESFARERVFFSCGEEGYTYRSRHEDEAHKQTVNKLISCYLFLLMSFPVLVNKNDMGNSHKKEIPSQFSRSSFIISKVQLQATHRMSQLINAIAVFLIFVVAMPVFSFLPQAAVASLLVFASIRMAPVSYITMLWRNDRRSCLLLMMTTCICVSWSLPTEFWWVGVVAALLGNYDNHPLN